MKTVPFGLLNLTEGEYEVRGGKGNKLVGILEVKDGELIVKEVNENTK